MARLLFQGHGTYKIKTTNGTMIYVDPFIESDYEEPADIILVTHEHPDHNKIDLVNKKENCRIIRAKDLNINGEYLTTVVDEVEIEAVEAYNKNHKKEECVGYILRLDNKVIYCSGDTSTTEDMKTKLPTYNIDYALLPTDGIYNMDAIEAAQCAELINAKHAIPIHMQPYKKFSNDVAEKFICNNRLIVEPDEWIEL